MKIGISSASLYPMLLEDAVQNLLDGGVRVLELFVNAASELEPDYVSALGERIRAAGARAVSVHPFTSGFEPMLFFTDYQRRTEDGLRFYRRFFEAARILEAHLFVVHGDFTRLRYVDTDGYCRRFDMLRQVGAEYGVTVAQENVNGYKSMAPEFIREMRRRLPELRFVLDMKQCLRAQVPLWEMAEAMGDNIVHVHLSDSAPGEDCLLPGEGGVDFSSVFARLSREYPRADTGVIELYRKNYSDRNALLKAWAELNRTASGFMNRTENPQ